MVDVLLKKKEKKERREKRESGSTYQIYRGTTL